MNRVSMGCKFANNWPRFNNKSTAILHRQCNGADAIFLQGYGVCWCWCHLAVYGRDGKP